MELREHYSERVGFKHYSNGDNPSKSKKPAKRL